MGDMFYNLNVMNKALDASMLRQNVITTNIANQETPGYKRQEVKFESLLLKEIEKNGIKNLNPSKLEGQVYTDNANFMGRMDENSVDVDREMSELAKNSLRYDVLTRRATAQIQRFKTILQTIK